MNTKSKHASTFCKPHTQLHNQSLQKELASPAKLLLKPDTQK